VSQARRAARRRCSPAAGRAAPALDAVARGVLADQHELARAARQRGARRRDHPGRRHDLVAPLDQRDGAEGAAPVAAVGDLDVGRHRPRPRTARVGSLFPTIDPPARRLVEETRQRVPLEAAPEVDLGQLAGQLGAVTLDQTAHGGDARPARVRRLAGREDGRDRLLLGGIDEAAGVDDDNLGELHGREAVTGGDETAHEAVGVGLVLGAAERHDGETSGRSRRRRAAASGGHRRRRARAP